MHGCSAPRAGRPRGSRHEVAHSAGLRGAAHHPLRRNGEERGADRGDFGPGDPPADSAPGDAGALCWRRHPGSHPGEVMRRATACRTVSPVDEHPRRRRVRQRPALRRHRDRHRRGRRHVRPPPRPVRQARAATRTRRLPPARTGQLGLHRRFREGQVPGPGVLARPPRPRVPARGQLLRRGEHEVLRRRPVPAAPPGLRRAPPPRRDLPGVADRLLHPRALLQPGRAPLRRARAPRRGPDRRAHQRRLPLSPGAARTTDPATQRRPGEAEPAPIPPPDRRAIDAGLRRHGHARQRVHPLRPGRRVPLPGERQGRCPGDLRRPRAAARQRARCSPAPT